MNNFAPRRKSRFSVSWQNMMPCMCLVYGLISLEPSKSDPECSEFPSHSSRLESPDLPDGKPRSGILRSKAISSFSSFDPLFRFSISPNKLRGPTLDSLISVHHEGKGTKSKMSQHKTCLRLSARSATTTLNTCSGREGLTLPEQVSRLCSCQLQKYRWLSS